MQRVASPESLIPGSIWPPESLAEGALRTRVAFDRSLTTCASSIRVVTLATRCAIGALTLAVAIPLLLAYRVYFDRSNVPSLDAFIRFEPPSIGEVRDAKGAVLIEIAREYRRIVAFDEVPYVVRQAILAAEDNQFFSHSGIEYRSWPRIAGKALRDTALAWWRDAPDKSVRLPQGGSTLTQQLVRGYFLEDLTRREKAGTPVADSWTLRGLAIFIGTPAANKIYRKVEEARLTLWLEEEMRSRYGSRDAAKREIFARYASFIYLGHSRYGFAAAAEYYFGKPLSSFGIGDAGKAALLAAIPKAPRDYSPVTGAARSRARRNQILSLMARNGYIGADVAKLCQQEPIALNLPASVETEAPAAVEHVFDELNERGAGQFKVQDLIDGRIAVSSTVNGRIQKIVNTALENGLARYEKRHASARGVIQGSVVVLRNDDAAILAEAGGRAVYRDRRATYSDLNRATGSLRQPGSVWKPLVYLAAFREGLDLSTIVFDSAVPVRMGGTGEIKWIANYDHQFKGPIPIRQALAESRNGATVSLAQSIGLEHVTHLAAALGIKSAIQPYITSALGASEVRLVEIAGVYRAIASGRLAEPHIVDRVTDSTGREIYRAPRNVRAVTDVGISYRDLELIQEGLRGVVRVPGGTANALDSRAFPIQVMGKTGTTSSYRDALFVGSTYGETGITIAVRIGFDDNSSLGENETGGRTALPIFREIMLRAYTEGLLGVPPKFPRTIEQGIDQYIATMPLSEPEPIVAPPSAVALAVGLVH